MNTPFDSSTPRPAAGQARRQYLTFLLAGEIYGVDILKVQEIRGWQPVREVPETPAFIKGIMDLRGTIVPVMDLRARFGLGEAEYSPVTVVIVLGLHCAGGAHTLAVVVDAVLDVLDVADGEAREAPLGCMIHRRYIEGVVSGERMVILLDTNALVSSEDWNRIEGPAPGVQPGVQP